MKRRLTHSPKGGSAHEGSQLRSDESFLLQAFGRLSNPTAQYAATMIVDCFTTKITPEDRSAGLAIWTRFLQRGCSAPPPVSRKYGPTPSPQAGS